MQTPRMQTIQVFLILSGTLFCLIMPASAVHSKEIHLPAENIEIDSGSYLIIPCNYDMEGHFQSKHLEMEWGMVPEKGGDHKVVLMVNSNKQEPLQQPNTRASAFLSMQKGNCSLVISPTKIEDSGSYQVHLIVNGERFSPTNRAKVHVKTCIENFGADYCTCDEVQVRSGMLSSSSILVIVGCVAGGIVLLCIIGILIYFYKNGKDKENTIEEGEEQGED